MYKPLFLLYSILIRRCKFLLDVKWVNVPGKMSAVDTTLGICSLHPFAEYTELAMNSRDPILHNFYQNLGLHPRILFDNTHPQR